MKRLNHSLALLTTLLMLAAPSYGQEHILSKINIQASPETVWQVLTQFEQYPQWSQFIQTISTADKKAIQVGNNLKVNIVPPNEDGMDFTPEVLVFNANEELRWKGDIAGMSFLFSGEHYFQLERTKNNHTTLTHGEEFHGWLLPLLWGTILENTPAGFENFNKAIKVKAESI